MLGTVAEIALALSFRGDNPFFAISNEAPGNLAKILNKFNH